MIRTEREPVQDKRSSRSVSVMSVLLLYLWLIRSDALDSDGSLACGVWCIFSSE
jgi:hypothetical protein